MMNRHLAHSYTLHFILSPSPRHRNRRKTTKYLLQTNSKLIFETKWRYDKIPVRQRAEEDSALDKSASQLCWPKQNLHQVEGNV